MAGNERQLQVSAERCIGCRACATVCPAGLITLTDHDHRRTVRFAAVCAEECDRCAAACPTEAIDLAPAVAPVGEGTALSFALEACSGCGAALAPAEMLAHLRAANPAALQTDAEGQDWLGLCPTCRQQGEAQRMGREVLLTRSFP
jgi:Fe-S-cluster-containing hydrogenase component 2